MFSLSRAVMVIGLSAMLLACGKSSTLVSAALQASSSINPDARNRPSPVVIRVYELKTPATFESADFFSLFDKDQATLGADMLAREEFTLRPGDSQTINRELKPDTRFMAVFAGFREVEKSTWRAVMPLNVGKKNTVQISLDARTVSISPAAAK
ncbi:MAG: type VI secretion system lipoprotein TssJ [Burkholderiaceae bacterium]|nr:type VI secretion system lipoprotein TssJ [Burkholderiaceae bacterium]